MMAGFELDLGGVCLFGLVGLAFWVFGRMASLGACSRL